MEIKMLTKVCTKCEVEKSVGDYYKHKASSGGVRSECKCCWQQRNAHYREANKETVAESQAAYRADNKEAIAAYKRAWQKTNKETIAAKKKAYYQADKETHAKRMKNYQQVNKEVLAEKAKVYRQDNKDVLATKKSTYKKDNRPLYNALNAKRKATKLMATPSWADLEAIKGMYQLAAIFNRTGINLHVDHIVPLQGDTVCGLHCEANLQLMPASDNISKGNRHWPEMP